MTLQEWQLVVDQWIKDHGVRYFDEKTNGLLLMEEVGELSRHLARVYGEQSYKKSIDSKESKKLLADEVGDVLFVLTCLANQMNISLEDVVKANMDKKTRRDHQRHKSNPKIQ